MCVTLQKTDFEDLEVEYEPLREAFRITGCGFDSMEALGKSKATLKLDQATAQALLYIFVDEAQAVSHLVGKPFIEQHHLTVVRRGNSLRLFQERTPLSSDSDPLVCLQVPDLPERRPFSGRKKNRYSFKLRGAREGHLELW